MSKDNKSDKLYLGYDAGCLKCSTIATRIESEVGDRLALIPLASPQMRQWREELLGTDARWAPTLVRVSGGQKRAYVGWQIGSPLASALGAKKSLKILSTLGSDQLTELPTRGGAMQVSLNRRAVLWGSAVIAGMAVLMGRSKSAFAVAGSESGRLVVDEVKVLHSSKMMSELRTHLSSKDVANVVSGSSLGRHALAASSLTAIPSEAFTEASQATGERAPDEDISEVQATRVTYSNGIVESAVAIYNHESKTMIVSRIMDKPNHG